MAQIIAAGDEDFSRYMIRQLVDRVKLNKAAYEGAKKTAKEGEDSRSFIIRSKIAFNEADFEKMTSDDHKALHVIVAMSDPELKTNLLKLNEPITLMKV